jgi:uncharacterized membrane protein
MDTNGKTEDRSAKSSASPPCMVWLAVGLVVGFMYIALTPPFRSPDEDAHFFRAYHLSMGKIYATKYWHEPMQQMVPGDLMPASLTEMRDDFMDRRILKLLPQFTRDQFERASARPLDPTRRGVTWLYVTSLYSPVPYVPAAITIQILKHCGATPMQMLYAGRAANLAAYLALVSAAICIIPFHKWTMLLVALMPMPMFIAGTLSADPVTIGLAFLAIAQCLQCVHREGKLGWRELAELSATFCLLALCKQFYVLLAALFFLIPREKIGGWRRYLAAAFAAVALPVVLNVGWLLSVQSLYVRQQVGFDPPAQLHAIFNDPTNFLTAMYNAIFNIDLYCYMVGTLSMFNVAMNDYVYYLCWLALFATAFCDASEPYRWPWRSRVLCLVLVAAMITGIAAFMYLHWNPVGSDFLDGVQPRYFLPVLPLFLLALRKPGGVGRITRHIPLAATFLAVTIANINALWAMAKEYCW